MELHCWWLLCQGREESGYREPPFTELIYCHSVVSSCARLLGRHGGVDCQWNKLSGSAFSGDRTTSFSPPILYQPPCEAFPAQTMLWLHLLLCCKLGLFQAAKSESSCSVVETFNKCSCPFTPRVTELLPSPTTEVENSIQSYLFDQRTT